MENNNIEYERRDFFKLDRKPEKTNKSDKLFVKVKICWLCDKEYKNIVDKVELCKLFGNYLGAAHQSCIEYVKKANQHKFTPVISHNSECDNRTIVCF